MIWPRVRRSVNPVCRSLTSPGESRLDSPTSAKNQRCQKHSLTRRKTTALLDTHPERRLERFGPEIGQRRSSDPTGRASPRRRFRRHRGSFKMPLEDLPNCQRTADHHFENRTESSSGNSGGRAIVGDPPQTVNPPLRDSVPGCSVMKPSRVDRDHVGRAGGDSVRWHPVEPGVDSRHTRPRRTAAWGGATCFRCA